MAIKQVTTAVVPDSTGAVLWTFWSNPTALMTEHRVIAWVVIVEVVNDDDELVFVKPVVCDPTALEADAVCVVQDGRYRFNDGITFDDVTDAGSYGVASATERAARRANAGIASPRH